MNSKNEKTIRALIDAFPDVAFLIDPHGTVLVANKHLAQSLNCSLDSIEGCNVYKFLSDDIAEKRKSVIEQAIYHRQSVYYEDQNDGRFYEHYVNPIVDLDGIVIQIAIIARDITRKVQSDLAIKTLSQKLMRSIEEERHKITRDLHDECSQILTAMRFGLENLAQKLPANLKEERSLCSRYVNLTEKLGAIARNISSRLRPDLLDHMGLIPAFEWFLETHLKDYPQIQYTFDAINLKDRTIPPHVDIVLYRILQEGLNNIFKHAGAKNVYISLKYLEPNLMLHIQDDGIGFCLDEIQSDNKYRIGLISMRERAASIDGTFQIQSSAGKGTRIFVEIPCMLSQRECI